MRSRAVQAQQMPLCSRRRPVLVVSHDLDGVTTPGLPFFATSSRVRVAASPRPPFRSTLLAFPSSHLFPPAFPVDLASPHFSPATRRSLVRVKQPIMGFIKFPEVCSRGPHRLVPRLAWVSPSPRCTPAPRSLHSLPSRSLTLVFHHPDASPLVSQWLRRLFAFHSVHASARPSRRLLVVMDCSCLARHCAFASQGPLGHP